MTRGIILKKIILFIIMSTYLFSYGYFGERFDEDKEILINPVGVEMTSDGYYILDYFSGKILNYNSNLELKNIYKGFSRPTSIVYFNDYLYVTESEKNRIVRVDLYTGEKKYLGKTGLRRGEFLNPNDLLVSGDYLYAVDEYNYRVQVFDKKDRFVREIAIPKLKEYNKNFSTNFSIAVKDDELYLLDINNKTIYFYKNFEYIKNIDLKNFIHPKGLYKVDDKIMVYEEEMGEFVDIKTNEKYPLPQKFPKELVDLNQFKVVGNSIYYMRGFSLYRYSFEKKKEILIRKFNKVEEGQYIKPIDMKEYDNNIYILDQEKNDIIVYSAYNKYRREISLPLTGVTSFDIDENGDVIIFSTVENAMVKLDSYGNELLRLKSYKILPFAQLPWLIENLEYDGFERGMDSKKYKGVICIDKKSGKYYLINNKDKNVMVFDVKLNLLNNIGKSENVINIIRGKKSDDAFGNDSINYNNLTDLFYYKGEVYLLDSYYNRIYVLKGNEVVSFHQGDYNGLNSIYIEDDIIYVVDKNNFKVIMYNMDFEVIKEIDFSEKGYIPLKIYKEYLIIKEYTKNYRESYKILNIKDLF